MPHQHVHVSFAVAIAIVLGLPVLQPSLAHAATIALPGANLTVTVEAASATSPAGTNNSGFTADTDDPAGPFLGQPVHFKGVVAGGEELIYRYRLEFDRDVLLESIVVEGAAWDGGGTGLDVITLLDDMNSEISSVDASLPNAGNVFRSVVVPGQGARGRTFFLEETNADLFWRYRSAIRVIVPEPATWTLLALAVYCGVAVMKRVA